MISSIPDVCKVEPSPQDGGYTCEEWDTEKSNLIYINIHSLLFKI